MSESPTTVVIPPTISRKVWYWPVNDSGLSLNSTLQPCDATIVFVWNDTCVNLSVKDHVGNVHNRSSVYLHQGDVESRPQSSCATWMPYQKDQAAKS